MEMDFYLVERPMRGFNNIAELNTNTIVIVNDNNQSIAENYGGIYRNLESLRGYLKRGRNYKG